MTNAAEQRFSDMEWKAKRYDYLLTNDSEAVWQAERELQVMRERVAELEAELLRLAGWFPWGHDAWIHEDNEGWVRTTAEALALARKSQKNSLQRTANTSTKGGPNA